MLPLPLRAPNPTFIVKLVLLWNQFDFIRIYGNFLFHMYSAQLHFQTPISCS